MEVEEENIIIELTYFANNVKINLLNSKFADENSGKYIFTDGKYKTSDFKIRVKSGIYFNVKLQLLGKIYDFSKMFEECPLVRLSSQFSLDASHSFDMGAMFKDCVFLESVDIKIMNTENVIYMNDMFKNCKKIKHLPNMASWKTPNLMYLNGMFEGCANLTKIPNISIWDTSKLKIVL